MMLAVSSPLSGQMKTKATRCWLPFLQRQLVDAEAHGRSLLRSQNGHFRDAFKWMESHKFKNAYFPSQFLQPRVILCIQSRDKDVNEKTFSPDCFTTQGNYSH